MLKSIESVVLFVSDIEAAARWYADIFHCEVAHENPAFAFIKTPGLVIGFHPSDTKCPGGIGGTTVYWEVASIDEAVAYLVERGAKLHRGPGLTSFGAGAAMLVDPFGCTIGLNASCAESRARTGAAPSAHPADKLAAPNAPPQPVLSLPPMNPAPLYRQFVSQAQIDAQYNASLTVADPAAEMRHYVDRSAVARQKLAHQLNVAYGPTLAEHLDIFPAAQPHAPVFVFVHGGYWRALAARDFSCVALGLQALGITTVVVNYALCPHVSIDEITRQVRAALAHTLRNAPGFGGDAQRVAIGGHSAGAHLCAMALQADWANDYGLPADPFSGAVLVSGLYDLQPLRYSYLQPQIQLDDGIIRRNSPLFGVRRCATPVLLTWGDAETEEFARQSASLHDAWLAAGNVSTLQALPGAHHFSAIHGFEQPDSLLCRWVAGVLKV